MLFRQIEYFQAIIETGNFYQAAEKCNVSQSAISQQIKKLEQELGVKLLDRHNRTFSLTPAGEHFYRKSLILVSDIEQIKRETKRIADNDHATLRIGYYKGYHGNELSEAVAEFSSKYPTVEVSIIDSTGRIGCGKIHQAVFQRTGIMQGKPAAGYDIRQPSVFIQKPVEIQIIITYYKFHIDIRKLFLDVWCIFVIQACTPQIHRDRFGIFFFRALPATA